ncbi:MAG: hypothetical protein ACLQGV_09945 [Bryobacteraceae bacterium]
MKIAGYVLIAAAVVLLVIGHGKEGVDASMIYVGAALASAVGVLLFAIDGQRKAKK